MTQSELIERYRAQKETRRGFAEGKAGLLSYFGRYLRSGSTDIAIRMDGDLFLKNADRRWNVQAEHVAKAGLLPGPSLSFSALAGIGVDPNCLTRADILDWPTEGQKHANPVLRSGGYMYAFYLAVGRGHRFMAAGPGQFRADDALTAANLASGRINMGDVLGYWHVAETVLLKYRGETYVCGIDEGQYFVSQLDMETWDKPITTVAEAFESLKPPMVRRAEADGKEVLRQGEWFFVPLGMDDDALCGFLSIPTKAEFEKAVQCGPPLVDNGINRSGPKRNAHCPDRVIWYDNYYHCAVDRMEPHTRQFASGRVFHRHRVEGRPGHGLGSATGEHKTIKLDGWYEAVCNTEKASFGVGGKVD